MASFFVFSLYTLIFALFGKTHRMSEELIRMKNMSASGMVDYGLDLGTSTEAPLTKDCFNIPIPCQMLSRYTSIKTSFKDIHFSKPY